MCLPPLRQPATPPGPVVHAAPQENPRRTTGASLALAVLALAVLAIPTPARADDELVLQLGHTKLAMKKVRHGTFSQGSTPDEPMHEKDEAPAHPVTITKDYWIGKYPVTRGQFAKFVAETRYQTEAEKGQSGGYGLEGKALVQKKEFIWKNPGFVQTDEHPVVLVTYADANAFAVWASRKTGKRVRLPTEAEWEFAARAGTTTSYYDDSEPAAIGWFKWNAGSGTRPVGQKKPNAFGIYDMAGNVFEWCRDVHAPYREGAQVDPETATAAAGEPERRVLRGGSWLRDPKKGRSAARHRNASGSRNADNGFRIVVVEDEGLGPGLMGSTDFAPAAPAVPSTPTKDGPFATPPGEKGEKASASSSSTPGDARAQRSTGAPDAFSWGLLMASPLAAASAVVAWMLLRKRRPETDGPPSREPEGTGIRTRAGADGFFIVAPGAVRGTRARYRAMVDGVEVTDVVPLVGDETFVYTGPRPVGAQVIEMLPVAGPPYREPSRPPSERPSIGAQQAMQGTQGTQATKPQSRSVPPPLPARASARASTRPPVSPPSGGSHSEPPLSHRFAAEILASAPSVARASSTNETGADILHRPSTAAPAQASHADRADEAPRVPSAERPAGPAPPGSPASSDWSPQESQNAEEPFLGHPPAY